MLHCLLVKSAQGLGSRYPPRPATADACLGDTPKATTRAHPHAHAPAGALPAGVAAEVERRLRLSSDEADAAVVVEICSPVKGRSGLIFSPAKFGATVPSVSTRVDMDHPWSELGARDRGDVHSEAGSRGVGRGGNQGAKGSAQRVNESLTVAPSGASIVSGGHAPTRRCARPRQARLEVGGPTGLLRLPKLIPGIQPLNPTNMPKLLHCHS